MRNIMMSYCRQTQNLPVDSIAEHLNITVDEYFQIERGERPLSNQHAKKMEALFRVPAKFFHQAADQLKLILENTTITKNVTQETVSTHEVFEIHISTDF